MELTEPVLELMLEEETEQKFIDEISSALLVFGIADEATRKTGHKFAFRDGKAKYLNRELHIYIKEREKSLVEENFSELCSDIVQNTSTLAKGICLVITKPLQPIKNKIGLLAKKARNKINPTPSKKDLLARIKALEASTATQKN